MTQQCKWLERSMVTSAIIGFQPDQGGIASPVAVLPVRRVVVSPLFLVGLPLFGSIGEKNIALGRSPLRSLLPSIEKARLLHVDDAPELLRRDDQLLICIPVQKFQQLQIVLPVYEPSIQVLICCPLDPPILHIVYC